MCRKAKKEDVQNDLFSVCGVKRLRGLATHLPLGHAPQRSAFDDITPFPDGCYRITVRNEKYFRKRDRSTAYC